MEKCIEPSLKAPLRQTIKSLLKNPVSEALLPRATINEINLKDMTQHINKYANITVKEKRELNEALEQYFPRVELVMRMRFQRIMHFISLILGLLIAVTFQLDSFEIIKQLSINPELKQQLITSAHQAQHITGDTVNNFNLANLDSTTSALTQFDFSVMPHGINYYWQANSIADLVTRWLGVIVSAIFISFGAPFWFNKLKDVVCLRDKISERPGES